MVRGGLGVNFFCLPIGGNFLLDRMGNHSSSHTDLIWEGIWLEVFNMIVPWFIHVCALIEGGG